MQKSVILGVLAGFLFLYLLANIIASQSLSPTYFELINGRRDAVVAFLQGIKSTPDFDAQLVAFQAEFGPSIKEEVFLPDQKREQLIQALQQVLAKNPSSVQTLYNLSILYNQQGDSQRSQQFLNKAQLLDPTISNNF